MSLFVAVMRSLGAEWPRRVALHQRVRQRSHQRSQLYATGSAGAATVAAYWAMEKTTTMQPPSRALSALGNRGL
ncbi:MAG TPA: hypothetical protein VED59_00570, partial [Acidimicrobiales bacterium]|nr:hypothetical protein [Acidimicrobiales bacterium]